ncbi:hypothetical protein [uncultured Brevibacillus sp.]|uniref:hypothetical protein n=1 Tax=uncultured Brevibacillus sp. TaxID=169970 RepID=UPI0033901768
MRVSEVCALTWDCVDLFEGTIIVDKIMVNVNKEWVFGIPKTASLYRTEHTGKARHSPSFPLTPTYPRNIAA